MRKRSPTRDPSDRHHRPDWTWDRAFSQRTVVEVLKESAKTFSRLLGPRQSSDSDLDFGRVNEAASALECCAVEFNQVRKALGWEPLAKDKIFTHHIQGLGQAVSESIVAATKLGEEVRAFVRHASEKAGLRT